jgi:hypothetical protein
MIKTVVQEPNDLNQSVGMIFPSNAERTRELNHYKNNQGSIWVKEDGLHQVNYAGLTRSNYTLL